MENALKKITTHAKKFDQKSSLIIQQKNPNNLLIYCMEF
jgi:hypothetical protein